MNPHNDMGTPYPWDAPVIYDDRYMEQCAQDNISSGLGPHTSPPGERDDTFAPTSSIPPSDADSTPKKRRRSRRRGQDGDGQPESSAAAERRGYRSPSSDTCSSPASRYKRELTAAIEVASIPVGSSAASDDRDEVVPISQSEYQSAHIAELSRQLAQVTEWLLEEKQLAAASQSHFDSLIERANDTILKFMSAKPAELPVSSEPFRSIERGGDIAAANNGTGAVWEGNPAPDREHGKASGHHGSNTSTSFSAPTKPNHRSQKHVDTRGRSPSRDDQHGGQKPGRYRRHDPSAPPLRQISNTQHSKDFLVPSTPTFPRPDRSRNKVPKGKSNTFSSPGSDAGRKTHRANCHPPADVSTLRAGDQTATNYKQMSIGHTATGVDSFKDSNSKGVVVYACGRGPISQASVVEEEQIIEEQPVRRDKGKGRAMDSNNTTDTDIAEPRHESNTHGIGKIHKNNACIESQRKPIGNDPSNGEYAGHSTPEDGELVGSMRRETSELPDLDTILQRIAKPSCNEPSKTGTAGPGDGERLDAAPVEYNLLRSERLSHQEPIAGRPQPSPPTIEPVYPGDLASRKPPRDGEDSSQLAPTHTNRVVSNCQPSSRNQKRACRRRASRARSKTEANLPSAQGNSHMRCGQVEGPWPDARPWNEKGAAYDKEIDEGIAHAMAFLAEPPKEHSHLQQPVQSRACEHSTIPTNIFYGKDALRAESRQPCDMPHQPHTSDELSAAEIKLSIEACPSAPGTPIRPTIKCIPGLLGSAFGRLPRPHPLPTPPVSSSPVLSATSACDEDAVAHDQSSSTKSSPPLQQVGAGPPQKSKPKKRKALAALYPVASSKRKQSKHAKRPVNPDVTHSRHQEEAPGSQIPSQPLQGCTSKSLENSELIPCRQASSSSSSTHSRPSESDSTYLENREPPALNDDDDTPPIIRSTRDQSRPSQDDAENSKEIPVQTGQLEGPPRRSSNIDASPQPAALVSSSKSEEKPAKKVSNKKQPPVAADSASTLEAWRLRPQQVRSSSQDGLPSNSSGHDDHCPTLTIEPTTTADQLAEANNSTKAIAAPDRARRLATPATAAHRGIAPLYNNPLMRAFKQARRPIDQLTQSRYNVPHQERASDAELIRICQYTSCDVRRLSAPYAFGATGKLYAEYHYLVHVDGVGWNDELKTRMTGKKKANWPPKRW
ncbi:MAG: hypothetical protein Q9210_000525 [Variospora velana]